MSASPLARIKRETIAACRRVLMLVGEFVRQTLVTMPLETAPALGFSHTLARRRSRDFIKMITPGYKPQRLFRQTFLIERQGLEPFLNSTLGVGCSSFAGCYGETSERLPRRSLR